MDKTNVIPIRKDIDLKLIDRCILAFEWLSSISVTPTDKDFIDKFPNTLKAIGNINVIEAIKILNNLISEKEYGCIGKAIEIEEMLKVNGRKSSSEIARLMKELK